MEVFKSCTLLLIFTFSLSAQTSHKSLYKKAFQEQQQMLNGEIPMDFTRAVFITENSFHNGQLNYLNFKQEIKATALKLHKFIEKWEMSSFKTAGNWATFTYLTEKIPENNEEAFTYDFNDYFGEQDFSKMFVTKLMKEKKGNCHSLPYLYKILCDEMGADAHLAIAPNHVYIKHISEKGDWVNVELTNASFPKNKWIVKDFKLPEKAIKNKLYMQALSDKETIAVTMFDLANAYEAQFGIDSFYLSAIETALSHYPKSIALLMGKANYYTVAIIKEQEKDSPDIEILRTLQKKEADIDFRIKALGHQGMSKKMYAKMVRMMQKKLKKQNRKLAKKNKRKLKEDRNQT